MDNSIVPLGFKSRTSFTLKRVNDNQKSYKYVAFNGSFATQSDASCNIFDFDLFNTSIRLRPWIANNSCILCQVIPIYSREDSCTAVLEEAPVLSPTEVEFKNSLKYIASIHHKVELFGICRIIPPASWKSSGLLDNKFLHGSKFKAQVQRINELQNQYVKREIYSFCESNKGKGKRSLKISSIGMEDSKLKNGTEFTFENFEKYADDFKSRYFSEEEEEGEIVDSNGGNQSLKSIEGEYWRIVENPTDRVEVVFASDLDSSSFGNGFSVGSTKPLDSTWNLHNMCKLPGSLLPFGHYDSSSIFDPRMEIGMCFSSTSWKVEEHYVYSLCYMHFGAPKIWYAISRGYSLKLETVLKKNFTDFLAEHPELLHELIAGQSPSMLNCMGIPVSRIVQFPKEFIVMLPGTYYCGFSTGFNCMEIVNFAPMDWLPHGQDIMELYSQQQKKTSISFDKLLLKAASEAVRAQWEVSIQKEKSTENVLRWNDACGRNGLLTKALKHRVNLETFRRDHLCNSLQPRKMDPYFAVTSKRECCICFYDLYLSAAFCACSPDRYSCLNHARRLCSCPWDDIIFMFRYDTDELNSLVETLEGKA